MKIRFIYLQVKERRLGFRLLVLYVKEVYDILYSVSISSCLLVGVVSVDFRVFYEEGFGTL